MGLAIYASLACLVFGFTLGVTFRDWQRARGRKRVALKIAQRKVN